MKRMTIITGTALFLLTVLMTANMSEAQSSNVRSSNAVPVRADRSVAHGGAAAGRGQSEVVIENTLSVPVWVFINGQASGTVKARGAELIVVSDGNHNISVQSTARSGGASREMRFNALSQRLYFRATSTHSTSVNLVREKTYEIAAQQQGVGVAPTAGNQRQGGRKGAEVPVTGAVSGDAVKVFTEETAASVPAPISAPNTFTDPRDGQIYRTVKIGTQTWMAQNLNFNAGGSVCYDNDPANCNTYGRLYDWSTVMNGAASSPANPSGVQGICPAGWHVPSDAEWEALTNFVGNDVGTQLKSRDGWNNDGDRYIAGTDCYSFSTLPGGRGWSNGRFNNVGSGGYWWSATENDAGHSWYRDMNWGNDHVVRYWDPKTQLLSLRCVR